jgi:hypothetical protein
VMGKRARSGVNCAGNLRKRLLFAVLRNRSMSQARLNVQLVDGCHEPPQFAPQIGGAFEHPLKQEWLKPTSEVFDGAIALRTMLGNEDRRYLITALFRRQGPMRAARGDARRALRR